jgi:ATP-binding cassette, subfamily B, bacterial MsbA
MNAQSSGQLYRRLLEYVKPYRPAFYGAVVAMAITGAANGALAWYLKEVIDKLFVERDPAMMLLIPAGIVIIFVVSGIASFLSGYGAQWVANRVMYDLRVEMFAQLIRLPVNHYDQHTSGSLMSKIANDVQGVAAASTTALTSLVRDTVTLVGLLVVMFTINWKLSLVTFAVVPPIALIVNGFSKRLRQISRESQKANATILEALDESISAQRVVKIFGGQATEEKRFGKAANKVRQFNMKQAAAAAAGVPVIQVVVSVGVAFLLYFAATQSVGASQTTVGEFVAFITATIALIEPIKRLTSLNEHVQRGLAACESVFGLIDSKPEPDSGAVALTNARGDIRFDNVKLVYRDDAAPALDGVSLDIRAGETIALVGATGSGKSTLIHLIPRFYAPSSGAVLIDGHDVREVTLASLRTNISLVSQDIRLFNDTVAANIAYGPMAGASEDAIKAAAIAAHAWEFIERLPQGLATPIGENGAQLSGGQRQRIAIARALLKNAPILLLDEATNALDTESERLVQDALEDLMRGRTTIIVAHRLNTIEKADRIVVLDRGHIVEVGSHQALLAKNGFYANLHRLQYGGATLAAAQA